MQQNTVILTVTGSDGTGGSGVQADIRTIVDLGATAASVVTSITVQNTLGIQEFYDLPADIVRRQMEAIINDLQPEVVKVGLLRRADTVRTVADVLRRHKPVHVVYAPVRSSTRGDALVPDIVYAEIRQQLLPLCTVVLEPTDLPAGPRRHGEANQLSSAAAVFLARGETTEAALLHARTYLKQLPSGYALEDTRAAELYNVFLDTVERFFRHYADVAFYANQLNVSARYLGQVTRRASGHAPKAIIDRRLTTEIVTLLTTSGLSLKEIADRLGFASQAGLSRFFRKQKGVTPSQFKRQERAARS